MYQQKVAGNNVIYFEDSDLLNGSSSTNWSIECKSYTQYATGTLQSGESVANNNVIVRFKYPFSEKLNHIFNNENVAIKYLVLVWNKNKNNQRVIVASNPTSLFFPITNTKDFFLTFNMNSNKGSNEAWDTNFGSKLSLTKLIYEVF